MASAAARAPGSWLRSWSPSADQAARYEVTCCHRSGPWPWYSRSVTVQAGPSPRGRSNRSASRAPSGRWSRIEATWRAARCARSGDTSRSVMTEMTRRPSSDSAAWAPTRPAASVSTRRAQWVDGARNATSIDAPNSPPSSVAGTGRKGSDHDTTVANALARTSAASFRSTGNSAISPAVRSRAQASASLFVGISPVSTAGGSDAAHGANVALTLVDRAQTATAASTAGCGSASSSAARAAASSASVPNSASSRVRASPVVVGAARARSSQRPSALATECPRR